MLMNVRPHSGQEPSWLSFALMLLPHDEIGCVRVDRGCRVMCQRGKYRHFRYVRVSHHRFGAASRAHEGQAWNSQTLLNPSKNDMLKPPC